MLKSAERKRQAADILVDPGAFASVLVMVLVDEFGTEFFDWEPETLSLEVLDKWKVSIPEKNRDKIWALVLHLTTNEFTRNVDAFMHICNSLSGDGANFETYELPTADEICWGITECFSFEPPEDEFSEEIKAFILETLKLYGYHRVPKLLERFVQMPVDAANINDTLEMDGIDYNAFWDAQMRNNIELDQGLVVRLTTMIRQLASVELKEADPQAVHTLLRRAETTLGGIEQERQQAQETVRPLPSL